MDAEPADLTVTVHDSPSVNVVEVRGELDWSTARMLRQALLGLDQGRASSLVVDLSQLSFLDSSGMGVLVSACRRTRASGGTFSVSRANGEARRALEIAGLTDFLGLDKFEPLD